MRRTTRLASLLAVATFAGCAANTPRESAASAASDQALAQSQAEQERLRQENQQLQAQISSKQQPAGFAAGDVMALTPANARAGECYARVQLPARYDTRSQSLLKSGASQRVEVSPARFEWTEETKLIRPAYEKIVKVLPAQYRTVQERVLVKPASEQVIAVPATYKTVTEQVLVRPAHTEWKRGRGAFERVDSTTGEIMCLVDVPAEYKTVSQRVVDQAAGTRSVPVPAQYESVSRQELVKEAEVIKETVAAEYETVRVQKLVSPASERRIEIPAQYQQVSQRVLVSPERAEWAQVVCKTNEESELIRQVQTELKKRGHHPGPVDGVFGPLTVAGVRSFEQASGLPQAPVGAIPYATLDKLSVARPKL